MQITVNAEVYQFLSTLPPTPPTGRDLETLNTLLEKDGLNEDETRLLQALQNKTNFQITAPGQANLNYEVPFVESTTSLAPDLKAVEKGGILKEGQEGPSVQALRDLLSKAGFSTPKSPVFDAKLAEVLGKFQLAQGLLPKDSPLKGILGSSTLKSLRAAAEWGAYSPQRGQALARHARNHISGGTGKCYRYVALAIDAKIGRFLTGLHAYMAAHQLAKSPLFQEVKLAGKSLKNLPAGAVVVWSKGSSKSGHISIADGKGREISDHVGPQMTAHYGGGSARVFLPK